MIEEKEETKNHSIVAPVSAPGENSGSPSFSRYKKIIFTTSIIFAVFGIASNSFLQVETMKKGGIFLAFLLGLTFLAYPTKIKGRHFPSIDFILSFLGFSVGLYTFFRTESFQIEMLKMTSIDLAMSILAFSLVILATKRAIGKALAILPLIFMAYALFGDIIPGVFGHYGFSPSRFFMRMYMVSEGLYGITSQTAFSYIFLFLLFGGLLVKSGVGEFFTDAANRISGASVGGPAKVAVLSSGLMGSISGSAAANVATTGAFTIPLMKKEGFSNKVAGSIEAVASTGGLIMPPIMGSAAFLMAQYLGVPYADIMLAAIIPAILFYFSVFVWVHFESLRIGHRGKDKSLIPKLYDLKRRIWLVAPLVGIIVLLVIGYTPIFAALLGMVLAILAGFIQRGERRMGLKDILEGLRDGVRSSIIVCIACITAGIIVGVTTMTGVGQVLTYNITSISGGSLLFALVLTAISCIVLSLGLPATAAYILVATIISPALITLGVVPIAAHMFVFYFASLSNITPPVAIASYTAAGLADAEPFQVAWFGMKIAAPGFIIPFLFAYNPILLFNEATVISLTIAVFTASLGVLFLGIAGVGYSFKKLIMPLRIIYFFTALLLIVPEKLTDIIGIVLLLITLLVDWIISNKTNDKIKLGGH